MLDILEDICAGNGTEADMTLLEDLSVAILKGSLCGLGQTAPNPVLSTLRYFKEEYESHIRNHQCRAGICKPLFHYEIDPELCNGCGKCARNCATGAITGAKKEVHWIDQAECTKCGICYQNCKYQAIAIC